jgi:protoheme ferro-lyase
MSVSQRPIAILLMAMGGPDSLELTYSAVFIDTLASVLTAHESSLCPTS